MMEDREQTDRLYAANLLNRIAGSSFDHRDVAVLARIIPLIEGDVAGWLKEQLRGVVSRGVIVAAVRGGQARPAAEAKEPGQ